MDLDMPVQITEETNNKPEDVLADLRYADEKTLRHEIEHQRQRLNNLEGFKKMFFALKAEINSGKEKNIHHSTQQVKDVDQPSDDSKLTSRINQLEEDLKGANQMAMLSMTTIGEYGSVLSFCKTVVAAESYEDLANLIYESMAAYALKVAIQINGLDGAVMYFQDELLNDEDTELINNLKDEGRIIEQDDVVVFNHKYINICVRDFPFDDQEKSGRLKDYLAIIASAADSCIKTLDADVKLERQNQNLHTILNAVPQMIEKIKEGINTQNNKAIDIYQGFVSGVKEMVSKRRAGDNCEKMFESLTSTNKEKFKKTFSQSASLTDNLVRMIKQLESTYIDKESSVDIRDEIELPGDEEKSNRNKSPLDF